LTGEIVQFHAEKLAEWLGKGAIPSDTVVRIQKQYARGSSSNNAKPQQKVALKSEKKVATTPAEPKVEALLARAGLIKKVG